jgi:tetratricopeptide (TPR) repeat protein
MDPASIAFAQLAEELRRTGANDEAVAVCQAGLARHPGYLSARVTLGRALIELGRLDDALEALAMVADTAPDNLAAIRGLAEINQQRGDITEALKYYRRALELARHDPDLEETVERMEKEVAPRAEDHAASEMSVEALFDFDRLVEQLGAEEAGATLPPTTPSVGGVAPAPVARSLEANANTPPAKDPLATLEAALREHDPDVAPDRATSAPAMGTVPDGPLDTAAPGDEGMKAQLAELEGWLQALKSERS